MTTKKLTSLDGTLGSRSAAFNITALVILVAQLLGAEGLQSDDPQVYIDFVASQWEVLTIWFINPIMSVVRKVRSGEFDKNFWRNTNLWTAVLSVAGVFLIPIVGEETWGTIALIAVNLGNFLFQMIGGQKTLDAVIEKPQGEKITLA